MKWTATTREDLKYRTQSIGGLATMKSALTSVHWSGYYPQLSADSFPDYLPKSIVVDVYGD